MSSTQKIVAFIERHGFTVVSYTDTTITAISIWTLNGVLGETEETFPATVQAARDWLGY